jgi:hypothetical protein
MRNLNAVVPAAIALLAGPALAATDPGVAELLERMSAYEAKLQQLEQRVQTAEQRADAAEAALARAQPAPPATLPVQPAQVRHFKDKASVPHGEGDGKFPNSWPIPGSDSYLAIGGYAKADFIQDFDYVGNANQFATATIPADGTANAGLGAQSTLTARETRVNLDFHKPTSLGAVRAFVEGDFAGSGNGFRLRHAYGQIGGLLAGQTWTTFADPSSHPYTLDFEGSDGTVWRRQAMLRYTGSLTDSWTWALAVEEPGTSITDAGSFSGSDRSDLPDLPGYIRYQSPRGSVQLAGILRQVRFDGSGTTDATGTETGYGGSLSFARKVFGESVVTGQFVYGDGIANYIQGLNGQGVDAVLDGDGTLRTLQASAAMLAYTHPWSSRWRSVLTASTMRVDEEPGLPGTAIEQLDDIHVNLIWSATKTFELGTELMWGRRTNQDGTDGDATRFQLAAKYYVD